MKENDGSVVNATDAMGVGSPGLLLSGSGAKAKKRVGFHSSAHPPTHGHGHGLGLGQMHTPGKGGLSRVDELKRIAPGQPCSPVREEEAMADEDFTSDAGAINKKFARDKRVLYGSGSERRQTLNLDKAARSGPGRRQSLGGAKQRRMSLGGASIGAGAGSGSGSGSKDDLHMVSDLREELSKREKLDYTRQNRLNGMDIKLKETQAKLTAMTHKFKEQKKEREELVRQVAELKKSNKHLTHSKRRMEKHKLQQEDIIGKLLAKVGGDSTTSVVLGQGGASTTVGGVAVHFSSGGGSSRRSAGGSSSISSASSVTSAASAASQEETFGDASEAVFARSLSATSASACDGPRRYTMAPGDFARARSAAVANKKVTDSHFIRVEGLQKGTNSQKLLSMVEEYGDVAQLRVTSDVVTGGLKGYVTFLTTAFAKDAVKGLKKQGFTACLVDKA